MADRINGAVSRLANDRPVFPGRHGTLESAGRKAARLSGGTHTQLDYESALKGNSMVCSSSFALRSSNDPLKLQTLGPPHWTPSQGG